jgi:branched-chain amino acid transport system permease protein
MTILTGLVDRVRHLLDVFSRHAWFSTATSLALLGALALVPVFVKNEYYIRVLNTVFTYSMLTLGLNIVLGYTGEFHFGQAALYAIGAYTTALLTTRWGVSFPLAFLASIVLPVAASLLLGFPSLRIRGDYLSLVTFAFGEIVRVVANSWVQLTRGPMGIPGIPPARFLGFTIKGNVPYYYYGLVLTALIYLGCYLIVNSHFGRAFLAIREDETAAGAVGINTGRYKVLAFAISALPAGIAGSYMASYLSFVGPTNFTADISILAAEAVILGGMASLPGSILGSAILVIALEILRPIAEFRKAFIGVTIISLLLFRPQGLLGEFSLRALLAKGVRDRGAGSWRHDQEQI